MKSILFSFFMMIAISSYGQVLSKTNIIFESKDSIVMNDGKKYKIIKETPLYAVADTTIKLRYSFKDKTLILNRVLLIKEKDKPKQLIEWVKGKMIYYEYRALKNVE
ncbi:hypothetical protein [Aquimarina sp. 2201CG14-23]|uniref:hypothetical protein n=1 Tax=Aquimarina mycalae TaxID=3040073 RepID=UPI002477E58D|nr:hypothetical protein [Aquimarina sp. 2201CG14-23]MDH7446539.1 hypothetical protein [Aquimarina sp. 2201CG14-23]